MHVVSMLCFTSASETAHGAIYSSERTTYICEWNFPAWRRAQYLSSHEPSMFLLLVVAFAGSLPRF